MWAALKLVWFRVPKKIAYGIATFILVYVGNLWLDFAVRNLPIKPLLNLLPALLVSTLIFIAYFLIAFFYFSLMTIADLRSSSIPTASAPEDDKRRVPTKSRVSIGTLTKPDLSVDILAEVNFEDQSQPDIQIFLECISLGDPYCPECSRPLNKIHGDWMINGIQVGYACPKCGSEIDLNYSDLKKDVKAEVRRNFDNYWPGHVERVKALNVAKT